MIDDTGAMIGVITDGDLRRHMDRDILKSTAMDVMTPNPVTISEDQLAASALSIMQNKAITSLFSLDEAQKPVGIIHIHDILRAGIA